MPKMQRRLRSTCSAVHANVFPTVLGYKMTRDDEIRKFVIMHLMCDLELDKRDVERRFGITFDEYFAEALDKLKEFIDLDLLRVTEDRLLIQDAGRYVLRNIAMCFDAYLSKFAKEKPIFSRTV